MTLENRSARKDFSNTKKIAGGIREWRFHDSERALECCQGNVEATEAQPED